MIAMLASFDIQHHAGARLSSVLIRFNTLWRPWQVLRLTTFSLTERDNQAAPLIDEASTL
jgi:hypothetical protein